MRRRALLLLIVAGCTVEQTVLISAPDARIDVRDCPAAFAAGEGSTCELPDVCVRAAADDPLCCKEVAVCKDGKLHHDRGCDPSCVPCLSDRDCPFGKSICEVNRCVPCPPTGACAACADGFAPLSRNGCATCFCAPKTQCTDPGGCGAGAACYVGADCVPGCAGDLACCANVCAVDQPACPLPAPLGCAVPCPVELGCDRCVAVGCDCVEGHWACKPTCSLLIPACAAPP